MSKRERFCRSLSSVSKNPHAHFGAPRFMKAFAAHGDFFASAAVAPQGASRWHLNQIYCECEAFTVKPRRVCRPQAAKKLGSFSAGACTWQKILLRLQVWNLFACGEQIMRAAACKTLSKSPAADYKDQFRETVPSDKGYRLCATPVSCLKGFPHALE